MNPLWQYSDRTGWWWRPLGIGVQQTIKREGRAWLCEQNARGPSGTWGCLWQKRCRTLAEARAWADRDPALVQEDGR